MRSLLPALLLLTGCPQDPCEAAAAVDPALAIGMGEKDFTPLDDGDTVTLNYGSQGGRHIWVALQAAGVNPGQKGIIGGDTDAPVITLSLVGEVDGTTWGTYGSDWMAMDGDAEEAEVTGLQLVVYGGGTTYSDTTGDPVVQDFVLSAHVEDVCGNVLDAERLVKLPD